jgi:hypothetical protein
MGILLLNVCDTKSGIVWNIDTRTELSTEDLDFIKKFSPNIYHNDLECYFWAFDAKLPSGRWLENIRFSNGLKTATALIF